MKLISESAIEKIVLVKASPVKREGEINKIIQRGPYKCDDENRIDFEKEYVVKDSDNYRGMSYGNWVSVWTNWLFSGYPEYNPLSDMLFLRGYFGYRYSQSSNSIQNLYEYDYLARTATRARLSKDIQRTVETRPIYNRVGLKDGANLGLVIPFGTSIMIPVMTATVWKGEVFEGRILEDEEDLRNAARKDTDESREIWSVWKTVRDRTTLGAIVKRGVRTLDSADKVLKGGKEWNDYEPMVRNLACYRIESPLFTLTISDKSPFRETMGLEPGNYDTVTIGYFLILKDLDEGVYRFHFGGRGRDNYQTDAIYEIIVSSELMRRVFVVDVSKDGGPALPPWIRSTSYIPSDRARDIETE